MSPEEKDDLIDQSVSDEVAAAIAAERQRCVEDVCSECAMGNSPVEDLKRYTGGLVHRIRAADWVVCPASAIHERAEKERDR